MDPEINISELIYTEKVKAEAAIFKAIQEFEKETNLIVKNIDVLHADMFNKERTKVLRNTLAFTSISGVISRV